MREDEDMEMASKENTAPLELIGSIIEAPVAAMNTDYERFRLVRPNEYKVMCDSMKYYGQISPATAGQAIGDKSRYDLIDGFKRYRACVKLEIPTLKIRLFQGSAHVMKAAILTLNGSQRSLHAFEEALVARSLFQDDCLNQRQIAALFGRHKSWACRRIALCERSCEELVEHIRLGLIGFAAARELWRLPRGNQATALACVLKHRLSSRETTQLVELLLQAAPWEHENIMRLPLDIIDQRRPPRPARTKIIGTAHERFLLCLEAVRVDAQQARTDNLGAEQRNTLSEGIRQTIDILKQLNIVLELHSNDRGIHSQPPGA
jgi:ParB-like chromosome segregation protein Spo0J